MAQFSTPRLRVSFVILVGLILFFTNIGQYDLWPADEPRFAEVAREMIDSGDYLVPRVNGEPYREKPPLLFWAIAAASKPFGEVTAASARIPSGVAALVTVLLTYLLAARLYDTRTAFWVALILMTGARFWWQARTAQTDMLLTACLTVALLAFWMWHDTRHAGWLYLFYGAIVAGIYTKGPPALVFPLLLIWTFYWKQRDDRRATHWVLGVTAVAAIAALWLVPARMAAASGEPQSAGGAIAADLFRQMIGRFFLGVSKAQWPWYYLRTLTVDWLPWTLFLPWTVLWAWRKRREGVQMRFLLSWIVPALIFFTICIGKRATYLLPLFPAIAVLIARSVIDFMDSDHAVWRRRTAPVWSITLLAIGTAPFYLLVSKYRESWNIGILVFSLCALAFAGQTLHSLLKRDASALHIAVAGHFAVLTLLTALFVLPALNPYKSARPFCEPVRQLAEAGHDFNLYSLCFSREEYIFYSKHFHKPVLVELPSPASAAADANAAEQSELLLRRVEKAVADVSIGSFNAVTKPELDALAATLQSAIAEAQFEGLWVETRAAALAAEVQQFSSEFQQPNPAFLFVQERDWRWILAIEPTLAHQPLIKKGPVGSREILLIANPAAAELLPS